MLQKASTHLQLRLRIQGINENKYYDVVLRLGALGYRALSDNTFIIKSCDVRAGARAKAEPETARDRESRCMNRATTPQRRFASKESRIIARRRRESASTLRRAGSPQRIHRVGALPSKNALCSQKPCLARGFLNKRIPHRSANLGGPAPVIKNALFFQKTRLVRGFLKKNIVRTQNYCPCQQKPQNAHGATARAHPNFARDCCIEDNVLNLHFEDSIFL